MWSFRREIHKLNYPVLNQVQCNTPTNIVGNEGVFVINMNLGTDIGLVVLNYNASNIPDRFQIEWDGNIVADSKFVGDNISGTPPDNTPSMVGTVYSNIPEYEYNGTSMVATGNNITFSVQQSDIADGTASEPTAGAGTINFIKTTALPTTVKIIVYAPLGSTGFNLTLDCPTIPATKSINLGYGAKFENACSDFYASSSAYYIPTSNTFTTTTEIFTNIDGTIKATVGWYSDGSISRFWDGNTFDNSLEKICSTESISLGYDNSSSTTACTDFSGSPSIFYIDENETFTSTTFITETAGSEIGATAGFYSDGTDWREWDGSAFISSGTC
jgi:hypothetical protein